jgi:tetratricopeptide (TPR) repeat protein
MRQGKVTLALKRFNDALAKDANYIPSLMNVGGITIRFRDYKTAQASFAKVLSLEPDAVTKYEATVSLGVAYRGAGEFAKAEESYLAAAKLDPANPAAYYNLGTLFQDYNIDKPGFAQNPAQKYTEAKKHFETFKSKAGSKTEWSSYMKDVDKRLPTIDKLIKAVSGTAAAKP